jgi:hypothetical protein
MKQQPDRWRHDYERDGYLVVDDCLDAATIARLRAGIEKIQDGLESLPPYLRNHVQLEKDFFKFQPEQNADVDERQLGKAIKLIMELPLFDPMFAELICFEPLLDVLETLFGSGEFAFHNYKAIIKAPRVSSSFIWHRDLPYLEHSTPNLITAMLCIDDMTEANGATVVYPGTHRIAHELVKREDVAIPESQLPTDIKPVTVTCPAGSAVLFHVNIIHGGGANRSPMPRRNIISIWSGPDTYPITGARYAYQALMPRSADPARRRQAHLTFPAFYGEKPLKQIASFHKGSIDDKESDLKVVRV